MPRILVFSRRFYPDVFSGTETVIYHLYQRLKQDYEVELVCGFRQDRSLLPKEAFTVDLSRCRKETGYIKLFINAYRHIRKYKPDLVLANSIEAPLIRGIPSVMIFYDINFGQPERTCYKRLKEMYYKFKTRKAQRIVAISRSSEQQLKRIGVDAYKIRVIHPGVNLRQFVPLSTVRKSNRFLVSYPSRIVPGKGQHLIIKAIAGLPRDVLKKIELWIVGSPVDKSYLKRLQDESRALPVSFYLDVPDIAPYYQNADVIVFPTLLEEGFGYTAIEGMACGRPVIYADSPAVVEATGGLGYSFRMGDSDDLRLRILEAYRKRGELEEMGKKARAWVTERYGWDAIYKQYREIISELLKK